MIRIRLKSFDSKLINNSSKEIINTAKKTGAIIFGPVYIPKKINRFIVTTSPHVDKDARECYELITYKYLIDIIKYNNKTINLLMRLNINAGVEVQIRLISK
ncbi:30S ribosomal protein S10 [Candidatus Nardonella dryophthoridicola]|uniref:Small ribosomal subunit protein uS10 n=1 Tax=endosymbiont of Metamasius hemipterus TaxID=204627 RepID=A0ABT0TW56_9GAMM|nr:30S ribosomal protein S10 [Candidatus Nardonella dryophthoridicola]MCM0158238.1 30S ribosomal protein S10 [endosymbiont of Metamasius hemipterus]